VESGYLVKAESLRFHTPVGLHGPAIVDDFYAWAAEVRRPRLARGRGAAPALDVLDAGLAASPCLPPEGCPSTPRRPCHLAQSSSAQAISSSSDILRPVCHFSQNAHG
jgi:hypothetical protein